MSRPQASESPAGLLSFLKEHCVIEDGHSVYTGPPKVQLGGRLIKPSTAYWLLTHGAQPPDKGFIVKVCTHLGCIDPDCHVPSRSPHGPMADLPKATTLAEVLATTQSLGLRLDAIEATQLRIESALALLDAKLEGLQ